MVSAVVGGDMLRAAQVLEALKRHGDVLITAECLALWPNLARLDLQLFARDVGPIRRYPDPATNGLRMTLLTVPRQPYRARDQYRDLA